MLCNRIRNDRAIASTLQQRATLYHLFAGLGVCVYVIVRECLRATHVYIIELKID